MYLNCGTLFDRILMTALFTARAVRRLRTGCPPTGMRINGFCTLAWPEDGRIGTDVRAVEKGNVTMTSGLSTVLRRLLQAWVDANGATPARRVYLFPSRDHPGQARGVRARVRGRDAHISTTTVRRAFAQIARRAGVVGAHVHPHTTRHTVAWTLCALGNSVESTQLALWRMGGRLVVSPALWATRTPRSPRMCTSR